MRSVCSTVRRNVTGAFLVRATKAITTAGPCDSDGASDLRGTNTSTLLGTSVTAFAVIGWSRD